MVTRVKGWTRVPSECSIWMKDSPWQLFLCRTDSMWDGCTLAQSGQESRENFKSLRKLSESRYGEFGGVQVNLVVRPEDDDSCSSSPRARETSSGECRRQLSHGGAMAHGMAWTQTRVGGWTRAVSSQKGTLFGCTTADPSKVG